jgi:CheY-like chemotaxis protein
MKLAKYNVLYAEDEFTNRKLLEIQLKKANLTCDVAVDGLTALQKVQENSYDVIILDQYMPGLNGNVLAEKIHEINPAIPLIAITSNDLETERLKAAGFKDVFIKPLRGTDHIHIIQSHIKGKT